MSFNPDPSKKAQQKVFTWKVNNVLHPTLTSKNVDVGQICSQKHLGMFLDFKFQWAYKTVLTEVNIGIAIIHNLQSVLPREALLNFCKSFIHPNFDDNNTIYAQLYNYSFHAKLESYKYKAVLAMTGAIKVIYWEALVIIRDGTITGQYPVFLVQDENRLYQKLERPQL